jgi:sulfoxide reductase heme-binding subunit YedZ
MISALTTLPAAAEATAPLTWVLIRSTGVIAIALLTIGVVVGIVGPAIRRPKWRLGALSIHTAASAAGVILLVGHIIFAIADSYVEISPLAVIIPGLSVWEPLWIGLGVVALDLLALIMVTSMLRSRMPNTWRRFHLASYPALALAWGHSLTAGTDRASQPMLLFALTSAALVAIAMIFRISRPNSRSGAVAAQSPTVPEERETRVEMSK